MEEDVMRKHYERTPKDILINLLVESRKQVDKLQKRNKELKQEIERLNNIINELEEYIVIKLKEFNTPEEYYTLKQIDDIHYRLQELKGSDK